MVNNHIGCCENCGRTHVDIHIHPVTIEYHTAHLCLACEHVLNLPENQNRFFNLARNQNRKQANQEMQRAHSILSAFIAVGVLFLVAVTALGVAQSYDNTTLTFSKTENIVMNEYLSFLQLKAFQ